MLQELDVVRLINPMPEQGLRAGQIGAIVLVHTSPHIAYEVEFCADDGDTIAMLPLTPDQFEPVNATHGQEA